MMPSVESIESLLMNCWSWSTGVPYCKGSTYEESKKFFEKEKRESLYIFKSFLDKSERDNGNEYAMEVWGEMRGYLLRADWTKGPVRVFRGIYKRASIAVEKRGVARRVGSVLETEVWKPEVQNIFQ